MEQSTGEFENKANLTPASMVVQKPQNNTLIKVLAIVFAVTSLGLGGFIAYDKILAEKPKCTTNNSTPAVEPMAENKGYVYNWGYGNFYIAADGAVYFDFDIPANSYLQFELDETDMPAEKGNYVLTEDMVAEFYPVGDEQFKIDGYKLELSKPVVNVSEMGWGQALTTFNFALVADDGTMGMLVIDPLTGKVTLEENIAGLENVSHTAVTNSGDGVITTLFFRDGTYKNLAEDFATAEEE